MSYNDEYEDAGYNSFASNAATQHAYATTVQGLQVATYQQVTTKIPPPYNGLTSWFAYEELIDDWCDITELDAEKQGPALKNRLEGDAAIYKPLLDRDRLRDENDGVAYFKRTLRPHFVKGSQSVFLWRFFQVFANEPWKFRVSEVDRQVQSGTQTCRRCVDGHF